MQFNVTNGPVSTWDALPGTPSVRRRGRPSYPHATRHHPSIYDDFDAIMAAAALLRDSGAGRNLDAAAWRAAYDYYGHDATGVSYANEVVARAIGLGPAIVLRQLRDHARLIGAVDAAWGNPGAQRARRRRRGSRQGPAGQGDRRARQGEHEGAWGARGRRPTPARPRRCSGARPRRPASASTSIPRRSRRPAGRAPSGTPAHRPTHAS